MKWNIAWDDMSFADKRFKESFLIQACGTLLRDECTRCAEGKGMWVGCRTIQGEFSNACGNCKRLDKGMECSRSEGFLEVNHEVVKLKRDERKREKTPMTSTRGRTTTAPASYKD